MGQNSNAAPTIDPIQELKARVKKAGSYRKLAKEWGLSGHSRIYDAIMGRRPLGDDLLAKLGIATEFVRKAGRGRR